MRVFLAGATGAVGRRLVPQLVARGHQVTGTTRSTDKLDELRALGAEPVVVDGLDPVTVGNAVAHAKPDAIIHQMTALAGEPDLKHFDRFFATTNALRTKGNRTPARRGESSRSGSLYRAELHRLDERPQGWTGEDGERPARPRPG